MINVEVRQKGDFSSYGDMVNDFRSFRKADAKRRLKDMQRNGSLEDAVGYIGMQRYKKAANAIEWAGAFQIVRIVGGVGPVADAMEYAQRIAYTRATDFRKTGRHSQSFVIYAEESGRGVAKYINISQLPLYPVTARTVMTIVNIAPYATILESTKTPDGILYMTAKLVEKRFGKEVGVAFDFVYAPEYDKTAKGGTLPRLRIGSPGAVKRVMKRPGTGKARYLKRGYAQVKGRSR